MNAPGPSLVVIVGAIVGTRVVPIPVRSEGPPSTAITLGTGVQVTETNVSHWSSSALPFPLPHIPPHVFFAEISTTQTTQQRQTRKVTIGVILRKKYHDLYTIGLALAYLAIFRWFVTSD